MKLILTTIITTFNPDAITTNVNLRLRLSVRVFAQNATEQNLQPTTYMFLSSLSSPISQLYEGVTINLKSAYKMIIGHTAHA